ncbi:MAG: hypothetical protein IT450_16790 [Phycisphaerales bacterium]|nr:hypothetical protein [Phycisphaerales bacterium]
MAERWYVGLRADRRGRQEIQREGFVRRAAAVLELEARIRRVLERARAWRVRHPLRRYGCPSVRGLLCRFPHQRFRSSERSLRRWRRIADAAGIMALACDGRGSGSRGRLRPRIRIALPMLRLFGRCVERGDSFAAAYREASERARAGGFMWGSLRTVRRRYDERMDPRREG